jgi:hypothetical protein
LDLEAVASDEHSTSDVEDLEESDRASYPYFYIYF